jgi:uncharacterized protein YjiS (DUF1127 family)
MSMHPHQLTTNHHVQGISTRLSETLHGWRRLGETLHIWRQRYQARQELARWTDRDLHDVGLSWGDIASEVEKPFWRA